MERARYWFGRAWILLVVTVLVVGATNVAILQGSEERTASSPHEAPRVPVAIVLGAKVNENASLSTVLRDRMKTAVQLYREKKVSKLLLTGDHGTKKYDEVNNMRRYAVAQGVPGQDVFMDHAGFDTYDSMYRARSVFGVKKALIVTQRFHLGRSLFIARALGITAIGVPSDQRVYQKALLFDAREILARTKAWFDVEILKPKPKFLGPKIDIAGDGRATWDEKT